VIVGADAGDDAGVFLHEGRSLVATVDFITPVCDDPARFGRIAAANSLSDVYAMGGVPLFALNVCCFPARVPREALAEVLEGGARALVEAGAALLGGHTVQDDELKYGLAVVGQVERERMLTLAGARAGDRLVLTKPLGTGLMINAYKQDRIGAAALEPALVEMERLNSVASRLALEHGARAATDITGFGLARHGANLARASGAGLALDLGKIPVHEAFAALHSSGVTTCSTEPNRESVAAILEDGGHGETDYAILFDPQTSGGLLLAVPPERADGLVDALCREGHRAAVIGEVLPPPLRLLLR
jgi:selenide,water dikinase